MADDITVIDVGGTHLRRAVWSPGRGVREVTRRPSPSMRTHPGEPVPALQRRMADALCEALGPHDTVAGVSFGAALDHRGGTVYASAPLWGGHSGSFDLLGAVRARRPDVRWHIVNDVTAALLHAASAPHRRGHRKLLLATVSTGIACRTLDLRTGTVPVDGAGLQGEIGHLPAALAVPGASGIPADAGTPTAPTDPEAPAAPAPDAPTPVPLCDCGRPGHVAAYASGPGINRLAAAARDRDPRRWDRSELGRRTAAGEEFEPALRAALDAGDPLARDLLATATAPMAGVLRTALCLDPEIDETVLTGGVVHGLGHHYREALLAHLDRAGLYLTSDLAPDWIERRITLAGPGEADPLAGAGIAASRAALDTALEVTA
ncbi:ROK family protein [Streptomyces fumanus]|uniref:Transcriptional regulator n=1 Tax=Streptomyces fumanus TaxID=67302 RepID=A0A919ATI4_9ACTN|nr:ROK family protein [Streptomyces fumanus]GHF24318.1 transcriptional regulator [Streptomyces fumanus]